MQLDRKYSYTKCARYILQNDVYLFKRGNFLNKRTIITFVYKKMQVHGKINTKQKIGRIRQKITF